MDIAEFLEARYSEDEAAALGATPGPWRDSSVDGNRFAALVADAPHPDRQNPDRGGWGWDDGYGGCLVGESLMSKDRAHIARHNPTRVLADVAAKRRIMEDYRAYAQWGDDRAEALEEVLRELASVYGGHADYREEWRI